MIILKKQEYLIRLGVIIGFYRAGIGLLVIKEKTFDVCKIINAKKSRKKICRIYKNKFL